VDRQINEHALKTGGRLITYFTLHSTIDECMRYQMLWAVTAEDRRFTTLLLQDDERRVES